MQDSRGFIWIGTQAGLQRYDGRRFITYLANVRDPEALQSDWIQSIYEDSKKRLWIGTNVSGVSLLNRSTGKFYNFNLHVSGTTKKPEGIWQIIEDRQGTIWLSAFDGYYTYNESTRQFESANDRLRMRGNTAPSTIAIDDSGNLWFSTTGGVKMLESHTRTVFDYNNNPSHLAIFDLKDAISIISFDQNNIWISTGYDHILYRYAKSNNSLKSYSFTRSVSKGSDVKQKEFVGGIFKASDGRLFLPVFSRGIAEYDQAKDTFHIINLANNDLQGLHAERFAFGPMSLNEDREKSIWISTDAGLNILKLESPDFVTVGLPGDGATDSLLSGDASGFTQTKDGDIYVSYYFAGGGIKRFDRNLKLKKHYTWKGQLNFDSDENQLWGLFQDRQGVILAPNQTGNILQLNTKTEEIKLLKDSILHGHINHIYEDNDNNLWVAHDRKGLLEINGQTKKTTAYRDFINPHEGARRRVRCLLPDGDRIWVGTIQNGLQLFDKKTKSFIASYQLNERERNSISNNNIIDLLSYNADTLIIATLGGINIFDKNRKTFTAILSKDGLPNNLLQAIVLDNSKNLWAAFAGGLSKIKIPSLEIINYDETDGIVDNRFASFIKLQDGRLIAGASKSFLVFDPGKLKSLSAPPDVTITGFSVGLKPLRVDSLVNSTRSVELNYLENDLHIEFASLQFQSSKDFKYYYQLAEIDREWIISAEDQSVSYSQLPPGKYTFRVKCANREGVFCNSITSLSVYIIPPFWERWWFLTLIAIALGLSLYAVIRWRERNITAIESGKTRVQQLTAEKYKAQLESEQIINFFSTSLFDKHDVDDVLWDVAKNLIGKLGFEDCMIYLWNSDQTKMVQKAGYGLKGSLEELEKNHFDVLPGQGVVGAVMKSGEPIIISDTRLDSRYRVDEMDRLSEICVPIKYNEQLIGVIDSEHHEKNFFTRSHLQTISTIATLVATRIQSIESDQRLRQQKAELEDINQRLAEVQLAALRSQMNPHFIFNALNSIKKFVIANEPVNAEKYLGKFSRLMRSILDNSRSGMVTLEKEVQLLHLYLDLEQLRFGSKLNFKITVDENLQADSVDIPSMIVQPFVENALLHGILHRDNGGMITIDFTNHDEWIEVVIEDNGVGRKKSVEYRSSLEEPHQSVGIEVTTKRLEALKRNSETPAGISIIDLEDENGTRVIIAIPL